MYPDGLVRIVSFSVESSHGGLQHSPAHSLASESVTDNHDAVTRVLRLVQLDHFADGVWDRLKLHISYLRHDRVLQL